MVGHFDKIKKFGSYYSLNNCFKNKELLVID